MELHWEDLGGTGPLLVLAHATGYCARAWRPVAARLAGDFWCVAFDGRAHGLSGRPAPESFNWPILGDDVQAVVRDVLRVTDWSGPVCGAGHSAGAAGLVLAEASSPGTFTGLWCFEPVLFPPGAGGSSGGDTNPMAEAARRRRSTFASKEEALAHYRPRPPFSGFDAQALEGFVDGGVVAAGDGTMRLACLPDDEARFYEMGHFERTWGAPEQLECPVVYATGDQPGAFGPGHAGLLAGRTSHGRAEVLAGLSHFGPLERPDLVADAIRGALITLL